MIEYRNTAQKLDIVVDTSYIEDFLLTFKPRTCVIPLYCIFFKNNFNGILEL